jgi:hypothetical protein
MVRIAIRPFDFVPRLTGEGYVSGLFFWGAVQWWWRKERIYIPHGVRQENHGRCCDQAQAQRQGQRRRVGTGAVGMFLSLCVRALACVS